MKKGKGSEELGEYIFINSRVNKEQRAIAGVGILIRSQLKTRIIGYSWINERIITLKLKTGRSHCNIIGVYAPVGGKSKETETFYELLQGQVNAGGKNDHVIIGGDLNARIGNMTVPKLIGKYGETKLNHNGNYLRDFCTYNHLRITNTFYLHKEIHKYTWAQRGQKSIIDYNIANEKIWPYIIDTRSYRGAEGDTDHYLVCSKIKLPKKCIRKTERERREPEKRFKIQLLEEPSIRDLYKTRLDKNMKGRIGDINLDWKMLETAIRKTAEEVLGYQFRRKPNKL